jgi:predicted nucleic acid-binding protein
MEIIQGLQKVGASPKRIQAFRTAIIPEEILPFDQDAADLAGLIAGDLDRVGRPIARLQSLMLVGDGRTARRHPDGTPPA